MHNCVYSDKLPTPQVPSRLCISTENGFGTAKEFDLWDYSLFQDVRSRRRVCLRLYSLNLPQICNYTARVPNALDWIFLVPFISLIFHIADKSDLLMHMSALTNFIKSWSWGGRVGEVYGKQTPLQLFQILVYTQLSFKKYFNLLLVDI